MLQSCRGLVDKMVFGHRLDLTVLEGFLNLNYSVIIMWACYPNRQRRDNELCVGQQPHQHPVAGEDEIRWAKSLFCEGGHRERESDASAGKSQGK